MIKVINILFLLFLIVFLLYNYKFRIGTRKFSKVYGTSIVLLIILLYSFRELGYDLNHYKYFYNDMMLEGVLSEQSFLYDFEIGWKYIIFLFKSLGFGFNFFLFFTSAIPFLIICFVANNVYKDKRTMFYLFFALFLMTVSFYTFSAIRAFFASSIILLSYYFFSQNKTKRALFCLPIAFIFHNSAFLSLMFPARINIKLNYYIIILLIMAISGILGGFYLSSLSINANIDDAILRKVLLYFKYASESDQEFTIDAVFKNLVVLCNFSVFLYISIMSFNLKLTDDFLNLNRKLLNVILPLCTFLFFLGLTSAANRILLMLCLGAMYIFPLVLTKSSRAFNFGVFYVLSVFVILLVYNAGFFSPGSFLYIEI